MVARAWCVKSTVGGRVDFKTGRAVSCELRLPPANHVYTVPPGNTRGSAAYLEGL